MWAPIRGVNTYHWLLQRFCSPPPTILLFKLSELTHWTCKDWHLQSITGLYRFLFSSGIKFLRCWGGNQVQTRFHTLVTVLTDRPVCFWPWLLSSNAVTVRIEMPFKTAVWLVSWWPASQLTAPGWIDNMLRPNPQFGRSNFDSTLKRINNNLSRGGCHSLSFSDKGEFVSDKLQADRWKRKKTKTCWTKKLLENFHYIGIKIENKEYMNKSKHALFGYVSVLILLSEQRQRCLMDVTIVFRLVYDLWAWGGLCICNQANLHNALSKLYSIIHRLGLFEPSFSPSDSTRSAAAHNFNSPAHLDSWRPSCR